MWLATEEIINAESFETAFVETNLIEDRLIFAFTETFPSFLIISNKNVGGCFFLHKEYLCPH